MRVLRATAVPAALPIRWLAIANRGEAAVRCIRAVKSLRSREASPLRVLALFTPSDRDALYVRHADLALPLPASGSEVDAWLDVDAIVATLREAGADAVWPGWGFLAEDAGFADAVTRAGLRFLGPPGDVLRAVGDKISAKQLAERVGVRVIPWSGGAVEDAERAARWVEELGAPAVLKAAAGGGGRGIRVVDRLDRVPDAFRSASEEALRAFGDDRIFVEQKLHAGRHVEVQIAADAHGTVLSLGCRDCSVQRRHQKLIEEAPPPQLAPRLRASLEDAAVRIAASVGYVGVATVEFLVADGVGRFLEVNPRLQVEHGVTEAITGIDLVEWQIRIAQGERLPPKPPCERGAAIEVRLCAEDPDADCQPAPGRVARFDPALGPGLRLDTGVACGDEISPAFDSLIAKLIASGASREEARARMAAALADCDVVVAGGATNRGLLLELVESEDFRRGGVDTGWLDRRAAGRPGGRPQDPGLQEALVAAAVIACVGIGAGGSAEPAAGEGRLVELSQGGHRYRLRVFETSPGLYRVGLDGGAVRARVESSGDHWTRLELRGRSLRLLYDATDARLRLELDGREFVFGRRDVGEVRASTPASVVKLWVEPGDVVNAGDPLVTLEKMKLEIPVAAPCSGVVAEVRAREGDRVSAESLLLVIREDADADGREPAGRIELWREDEPEVADPEAEVRALLLGYDVAPDRWTALEAGLEVATDASACGRLLQLFADVEEVLGPEPDAIPEDRLRELADRLGQAAREGAGPAEARLAAALAELHAAASRGREADAGDLRRLALSRAARPRTRAVRTLLRRAASLLREATADAAGLARAAGRIGDLGGALAPELRNAAALACHELARPAPEPDDETPRARLEAWLRSTSRTARLTPDDVSRALALAERCAIDREAAWLASSDARRRSLCAAVRVRRLYAAARVETHSVLLRDAGWIDRIELADGQVVLGAAFDAVAPHEIVERIWQTAAEIGSGPVGDKVLAIELLTSSAEAFEALGSRCLGLARLPAERLNLTLLRPDAATIQRCFESSSGGVAPRRDLLGLHPEQARRIGLERLSGFEVERLCSRGDVHCLGLQSAEVPGDRRLHVCVDLGAERPREGGAPGSFESVLERGLHEAVAQLRAAREAHDWARETQWNRISCFAGPEPALPAATLERALRRLAPTDTDLGLERVELIAPVRDPGPTVRRARSVAVVAAIRAGAVTAIGQRELPLEVLAPLSEVERRVVQARRRGLLSPAETLAFLEREPAAADGPGPGRFEEYDLDARGRAVPVSPRPVGPGGCGVVFGVVRHPTRKVPEGMVRVLLLSDPGAGMGALAAPECERIVAALDLAERLGVPLEWVPISSGARIAMDSGTENLDATARVVRRIVGFTQAGGVVHLVVAGVNVGAQSYFDALATMLMHTRGALIMTPGASMVLTGRAALLASGSVTARDEVAIGGFAGIMGPNGQAQYLARDLAHAYEILFEHYGYSYVVPGEAGPRPLPTRDPADRDPRLDAHDEHGFARLGDVFDPEQNAERKRPFSMRALMAAVIDRDGGRLERWQAMRGGETAIVWDAHLGGAPVCLIGIESHSLPRRDAHPPDGPAQWDAGTLFPQSSKKVARALNAASGNRPAVVLANLSGFDGSPESLRCLQLEYGAEIARAVVNFRGPLVFLVVSRYHGGAYVVFSRALNESLHAAAVEGSFASVIGGSAAAAVVFGREAQMRARADLRRRGPLDAEDHGPLLEPLVLEKQAEIAAEFDAVHTVERARRVGSLAELVPASRIRSWLVRRVRG